MAVNTVKVTGDIYVPATGTDLVTNGDFAYDGDWGKGDNWAIGGGTANRTSNAASTSLSQALPITKDKTYLIKYDITAFVSGSISLTLGGPQVGDEGSGIGSYSCVGVAGPFAELQINGIDDFVGSIDNVEVYELAEGPTDTYPWDSLTDYSSGVEPLGIYNGERVYKSTGTHADGNGGTATYYIRQRIATGTWYITKTSPTSSDVPNYPRWGYGGAGVTGSYLPDTGDPQAQGTATVLEVFAGHNMLYEPGGRNDQYAQTDGVDNNDHFGNGRNAIYVDDENIQYDEP